MIEIKNLCKKFGEEQALEHLNLTVKAGECFGLAGPSGSGKTTLIRILAGLVRPDQGTVLLHGLELRTNQKKRKTLLGYMPDFFGVYENLTTMEYMEFYASIYGMYGDDARKRCMELLELVHLSPKKKQYVDTLSRGMKQRLCLARCLIHDPQLLLLDEPGAGLDFRNRQEMKNCILNLHQAGKTILLSAHALSGLTQICSDIGILSQGQLAVVGSVDEITQKLNASNPILLRVGNGRQKALEVLKREPLVNSIAMEEDLLILGYQGGEEQEAGLLRQLIAEDVSVISFHRENGNLEDLFPKEKNGKEVLSYEKEN